MALLLPQAILGTRVVIRYSLLFLFMVFTQGTRAQAPYQAKALSGPISLDQYARYANAGQQIFTLEQVRSNTPGLKFQPMGSENPNIGFTKDQFWVRFKITNNTENNFTYYLETARPITDRVELYSINSSGGMQWQKSGDTMPFSDRSFQHRKTIFEIQLPAQETLEIYIHYYNDGEVLNLPLILHTASSLLKITYFEQLVFGIFFGILLIAAIIYLFFFFALGEKSFLYYSMYVITVGLLQFSLDGYFNQYFGAGGGWFSNHAVVLFAITSAAFLGRYSEVYLDIKHSSTVLSKIFKGIYISLGILLLVVLFSPDVPALSYPGVNILGLGVLGAILTSVIVQFSKKIVVDKFFLVGIFFLILGFVIFILNNLSILPNTFLTQNSAKLGTGLEIIFLSLSMSNRIKKLKNEKEDLQELAVIRLQEMNALKSNFLSNLSHELRTPLNAIMGLADSMSNETDAYKIRNTSSVIKASSVRLLSLINDILDFSKIEKGELVLENDVFDPVEILKEVQLNYKLQAEEKGILFELTLKNQFSGQVLGDANRLAQIVNNILNNALKFTQEGRVKVVMETVLGKDERMTLILQVTDTGIGIPKVKMESIFESLTQESITSKRKYGGLGLGLYIIKVLVDLHHGKIHIKSNEGAGTTCTLQLSYPVAPISQTTEKRFPTESYDLLGSNILVVEDDPINQMVLQMLVKKWNGTRISFANNGAEGLEKLKADTFDLILMDLHMPVMDGYEACAAIREGVAGIKNKTIPIIAVTADFTEATKQRVKSIGMDDYLAKPVQKDKLYFKMIHLLEKAEIEQQK